MTSHPSTARDVQATRERLEKERRRTIDRIVETATLVDLSTWQTDLKDGTADAGSVSATRDAASSLQRQAAQRLVQIENALVQLESDTYGVCEVCGREIPPARLEAVPHSTTCVDHHRDTRLREADPDLLDPTS